ncbi:MAG: RNA polymerase sigma factor [Acidobacteria bacterium]|nr:RNA polymerase sigma factor [Acidobacteriota bacterium]
MTSPRLATPPGPAPLDDLELVARVCAGETQLFELLMRRYNQRLFRAARAVLRDDAEAEDVLQEAWVRAFAALGRFEGRASVGTWLVRIALHEAFARRRRRQRFVALGTEDDMGLETTPGDSPEARASTRELRAALAGAIDALPEGLRVAFVLREVEGLSTAETAEALGLSPDNVKVRLHRARAALRRGLERVLGTELRAVHGFDGARCDRVVAAVMARIGP